MHVGIQKGSAPAPRRSRRRRRLPATGHEPSSWPWLSSGSPLSILAGTTLAPVVALVHAEDLLGESGCLCCAGSHRSLRGLLTSASPLGQDTINLLLDWTLLRAGGRTRPTRPLIGWICSYNIGRDAKVLQQPEPWGATSRHVSGSLSTAFAYASFERFRIILTLRTPLVPGEHAHCYRRRTRSATPHTFSAILCEVIACALLAVSLLREQNLLQQQPTVAVEAHDPM
jgi:hypothetical protein